MSTCIEIYRERSLVLLKRDSAYLALHGHTTMNFKCLHVMLTYCLLSGTLQIDKQYLPRTQDVTRKKEERGQGSDVTCNGVEDGAVGLAKTRKEIVLDRVAGQLVPGLVQLAELRFEGWMQPAVVDDKSHVGRVDEPVELAECVFVAGLGGDRGAERAPERAAAGDTKGEGGYLRRCTSR